MINDFEQDIIKCLDILRAGGTILYPTDTIWGVGCDATNEKAVVKIYDIKKREDSKSLIILVADEKDILKYVAAPDPNVFDFIEEQKKPTTIIFDSAIGLAENVVAADGSVGIRIVKDEFCRHLIKRLQKPIVSTSANMSGEFNPAFFAEVSEQVKQQVDYVVKWRQQDEEPSQPSQIIKWHNHGSYTIIRK